MFADEDEEKPEVKVTADTDSEDEEVEEAAETTAIQADKPSVPPLNSTKHTQQKSAATVSLITKHNNGTLNMWNVMFADKSRFGNLLNIRYNHLSWFVCRAPKRILVKGSECQLLPRSEPLRTTGLYTKHVRQFLPFFDPSHLCAQCTPYSDPVPCP